jgi:hypothetical protein
LNVEDLNGLFGAPTVSGNFLDFDPVGFTADCASSITCPPTPDSISDTLTFQIDANAGFFVDRVRLEEEGTTELNSLLGALGATSVVGDIFLDILEINGSPVNNVNANATMNFTSGGTFNTNEEGAGNHGWTGLLVLDIDTVIANAGLIGQATLVEVSLANTLTAFAEDGAIARIDKRDVDGIGITVIPEPSTTFLIGLGLAALARRNERPRGDGAGSA